MLYQRVAPEAPHVSKLLCLGIGSGDKGCVCSGVYCPRRSRYDRRISLPVVLAIITGSPEENSSDANGGHSDVKVVSASKMHGRADITHNPSPRPPEMVGGPSIYCAVAEAPLA